MNRVGVITVWVFAHAACRPPSSPETESSGASRPVSIRVDPGSAFEVVRRGPAPAFRARNLHVYVTGGARDLDTGLPGIAVGTARGPMYGLLSGYFAPQLLALDSSTAYALEIDAARSGLRVTLRGSTRARTLSVRFAPPRKGRVRVTTRGPVDLAFRAARTTVRGLHDGRPSFSLQASAGDRPRRRYPRADRLIVESARFGPVSIDHGCPRITLIHPLPRGSTSVFLLRAGPDPGTVEPLYAPRDDPPIPANRNDCRTNTSTIRMSWPPPA